VFPCAGPPAFLDDALFGFNDDAPGGDPANIFPDQTVFLAQLARAGFDNAHLIVPGSVVELDAGECKVTHPLGETSVTEPFGASKADYLARYRHDWQPWLAAEHASWSPAGSSVDIVAALKPWFEPLLDRAPITSAGIAGNVVLDFGEPGADVCIDFVESEVRAWKGEGDEAYVYKIDVDRRLVERLVADHTEDWVNSLFLSCRFVAHRDGGFNEYVMSFFKALSAERIAFVERSHRAARQRADEFFERDGWRIERWCPHRQADLSHFGEIDDAGVLTCSLHHWQFDLETGECLTSAGKHLRCARIDP
jgi:UDP-MurNAc hydroxylase